MSTTPCNIDMWIRDPARLAFSLQRRQDGQTSTVQAVDALATAADRAAGQTPLSIINKTREAPSGDPHDYVSRGPYWWPNPDTPDGLPYVRRDGEKNPECDEFDRPTLAGMTDAVYTLSLAWFFLRKALYAEKAAAMLHTFFVDPGTRMNPHLEFGQGIPGKCEGRGIGIIETCVFATTLIDAIGLVESSGVLPSKDRDGIRSWFADYLDWLLHSAHGKDEAKHPNNHGTAYDLQVAVFSLFTGRDRQARDILTAVPQRRIATQIEPDGRQPRELSRTRALSYSTSNLGLLFDLATVAGRLGIDLWHVKTDDGRSIQAALDWLIPFWIQAKPWPYQQITPFSPLRARELLCRAYHVYGNPTCAASASKVEEALDPQSDHCSRLCWPLEARTDTATTPGEVNS